ncbi:hypothetical protein L3Q67_45370 (plasmid) [Saccharothrix sp. AJ9571]|nr:hypothetical protein L3Q67_45370 [Saccharothrix sp. AJ9571]
MEAELAFRRSGHDDPTDEQWLRLLVGGREVGAVLYHVCPVCRTALLHEIGIEDDFQHHGYGTRAIEVLRTDFPGYRWTTTPQKTRSRPWWQRLQQSYPGEYQAGRTCPHIAAQL